MCTRALLAVCPLVPIFVGASLSLAHPSPARTASTPSGANRSGADEIIHWQRNRHALDHIPSTLPRETRAVIERYGKWAEENEYQLHLTDEGDVVLLVRGSKRPKSEMRLIEEADAYLDSLLATEETDGASEKDTQPLVLIQARSQKDYNSLVDHVVAMESYLTSWSRSGKRDSGFVLQKPLCAAWMEDPPGVEEWSPENELVHRMARLRLLRSFGQLPNWVTLGVAWVAEDTLRRGIYCFPYRDSFVGVSEHSSWSKTLKQRNKKQAHVDFALVSGWQRGTWDQDAAHYAFGVIRFFERAFPGSLTPFLTELRETYEEKRLEHFADGTWKINTSYEVSHEDQTMLLEATFGDSVFSDMASFFKKGMPTAKLKKKKKTTRR